MVQVKQEFPEVVVLNAASAGIATVRGIAQAGIKVHAVSFDKKDAIRYSNCCRKYKLESLKNNPQKIIEWLIEFSQQFSQPPVLIPCSDKFALMVANFRSHLKGRFIFWQNSFAQLNHIISKEGLQQLAESAQVPTVPCIEQPGKDSLDQWLGENQAPYIMKPFYEGNPESPVRGKNLCFEEASAAVKFVSRHGAKASVIQRLVKGGDGNIYDVYGMVDATGTPQSMATHRRIRQLNPDVGSTTFGAIPASPEIAFNQRLKDLTLQLLEKVPYHGIFGIEWLHDTSNDELYVIDFNARPFSSIGHLVDCGINLPLLAYYDLIQEKAPDALKGNEIIPKNWVDFRRDLWSFRIKSKAQQLSFKTWSQSVFNCRSYAYWRWRDPLPAVFLMVRIIKMIGKNRTS